MRIYWRIFLLLPLAPFIIASAAAVASLRISQRRWTIHCAAVLLIVLTLPLYMALGRNFEAFVDDMNGGEMFAAGFVILFYAFTGAMALIGYGVFAWCTRARPPALATAS
jgi:hypothetical protein